jgi:putative endonuclease
MGCKGSSVRVRSPRRIKWADKPVHFFKMYITYILYSNKIDRYYTGHTENLERRMEEHNRGKTPFMSRGIPWKVMYQKEFGTRKEAMKHEEFIKKRGAKRFLDDTNAK